MPQHLGKKPVEKTAGAVAVAAGPAKSSKGRRETTTEDEIRVWAEDYARKNGWVLNPDTKILDTVIRGLVRNEQKFGERYCPCRLRSRDVEIDRAIICPCINHRDEIAKDGHCYCQLYYRKDAAELLTGDK